MKGIEKRESREDSKRPKRTKGKSKVAQLEEELQAAKHREELHAIEMRLLKAKHEKEILQLTLSASADVTSDSTVEMRDSTKTAPPTGRTGVA